MTENYDSYLAKLVAMFSAVDKPIIKEQSNSAAPAAQTVHNFNDKVYFGIIGNMHSGTFIHYAHAPPIDQDLIDATNAVSMIKRTYQKEFEKYNPFNVDSGFQFDMNSWIPIKLIKDISDYEKKRIKDSNIDIIADRENSAEQTELFRLIADELAETHLVIITGTPGAGKTTLAHKIAFDYASDNSKLPKYDIVLMTEFRKTSDKKNHNSIIDMALYGLEKMTENSSLSKFIKRYIQENNNVLIVLDGYDEAVGGQCSELDKLLRSYGSDKKFDYDLIVTRRPTKLINRKEKLSFTKMVGFNLDDIIKYIKIHFANHEDKDKQIKSILLKIINNATYIQMASTPLLLTFICLVHAQLEKGTRVELYEKIVCWFIQRKLIAFPNLLAKLDNGGNIGIGLHQDMADFAKQNYVNNWMCFEQFKRLGYICLMYLANDKYQFSLNEISNLQSDLIFTINIFAEIGILYSETAGLIGKQITIYQFAHQSFQEYFAAVYALKWEEECKMKRIDYSIEQRQRIAFSLHQRSFFIEILLTDRNDRLIESAQQYLIDAKLIRFDIQSSIQNENWQQLEHVNKILDKCQNISEIAIFLHEMLIDEKIELVLPNVNNDVSLWIINGKFVNNQSNMISISQTTRINISFVNSRFSFNRLRKFAEYVNANANQFKAVRFFVDSDATIETSNDTSIVYKQYTGILQITQLHSFNETSIYNIIQLFTGIKILVLAIFQPKTDEYIQEANEYSTMLTNLTELEATVKTEINEKVSNRYWNYINKILQQCPVVNNVFIDCDNATIEEPIELQFLPIKHCITVRIMNAIFNDNQLNMISISDAKLIDIIFENCRFTLARLSRFAEYVNANANQFKAVRFFVDSDATIETSNDTSIVYKQYTGILQITQLHSFNETSIYNIIQLFTGIKILVLAIFQPKTDEYIQEANEYSTMLTNLTELEATVKTEINEKVSNRYWNYINKILQKCPVVNNVFIDCDNATIEEPIDLQFLPIKHCITVKIQNAIFNDNQLNMILINDSEQIDIIFENCRFTLARLSKFAEYVDANANHFEAVRFFIDNYATIDAGDNTSTVYNKQYTGTLEITQLHSFNETSTYKIIQLFSGIKTLGLDIFQPKIDEYIQEAVAYSTMLTNLTMLVVTLKTETNKKVEVNNRYWNYINKILQQCPVVNNVVLRFDNAAIEEAIDLQFLPIEHCITVGIGNAIFNENQLNMVSISDAKRITIQFYKCQFTPIRLMQFALYVDENVEKFERIDFANVINQVDIDEYTQYFKNIMIRRRLSTAFSIVKRDQQITDAQQQQNGNELQDIIHLHVKCDICGMNPIIGIRYKCTVCDDYYLCTDCKRDPAGKHDAEHEMISIDDPNDLVFF